MVKDADIQTAAHRIKEGGLVAFPTETVYGIGANALSDAAVLSIFEAKGRPRFNPLIVHVSTVREAERLTTEFSDTARRLAEAFWPGPMTLVLPKGAEIPDTVTAGLPTVAIRVPSHPVAQRLLELAGLPIAAPSANLSNHLSATSADAVRAEFGEQMMVLDGGSSEIGVESTVIALADGGCRLLRKGAVTRAAVEQVIGKVVDAEPGAKIASPGMLERHYAPRIQLRLFHSADFPQPIAAGATAVMRFRNAVPTAGALMSEVLSPSGDLREAARRLFSTLRKLEESGAKEIWAEMVPNEGIGEAINDKLRRGAAI